MKKLLFVVPTVCSLLAGCASDYGSRPYAGDGDWHRWRRYDYDHPDPAYGGYYADRYYRDDPRYSERRLADNDRVYRGNDGRFYCRRSDGSTGLIVGALAGGVLGNIIAPGGSKTLGTILGGAGGAAIGTSVDRDQARCR
jgi:hypothetical protein